MKFRNQIIGLMRFSYPAIGGFSKTGQSPEQTAATLYDPERLARRFALFEALALPSLLAQQDQDFRMVFLIGQDMPRPWQDRLHDHVAALPGARVVALEPLPHYRATRKALARAQLEAATHVTGFRLDDDDALDRDHIARMRQVVTALLPAAGVDCPLVTGCNRGFFLELAPEGNRIFDVVEKTPLGLGLAMTTPRGISENIFRRNHRFSGQFYNTFTEANTPAFIRTVHRDNDSDPHSSGILTPLTWDKAAPQIAAHFPFTADDLRAL